MRLMPISRIPLQGERAEYSARFPYLAGTISIKPFGRTIIFAI